MDEQPVELGSSVFVPHRLDLGAEAERWHQVFLDYKIIPPIDQLTRSVYVATESELDATILERPLASPIGYGFMFAALIRVGFPLQAARTHTRCDGAGRVRVHPGRREDRQREVPARHDAASGLRDSPGGAERDPTLGSDATTHVIGHAALLSTLR